MQPIERDIWSQWILERRHGGNSDQLRATLEYLYPIRDKVLANADLGPSSIVLDVGCGDGLMGCGALPHTQAGTVIFSDISNNLLQLIKDWTIEHNLCPRCTFLNASAEDLSAIRDESIDAVLVRSVLIYVADKNRAFREFYRVLKKGGRLSLFEPINAFRYPEPARYFGGYDVMPVISLAEKLKTLYFSLQPTATDAMLNFDERTLLKMAEAVMFKEIHLEYQVELKSQTEPIPWATLLECAGNPKIPTLKEAMEMVFTQAERDSFSDYLRPLVEEGRGRSECADVYLWTVK